MINVLKLKEEHFEAASLWAEAYHNFKLRDEECKDEDGRTIFPPMGKPFIEDTTTEPHSYKVSSPDPCTLAFPPPVVMVVTRAHMVADRRELRIREGVPCAVQEQEDGRRAAQLHEGLLG